MPGYQLRSAIRSVPHGYFQLIRLGDVVEDRIVQDGLPRMDLDEGMLKFQVDSSDILCRSRGGNYSATVVGNLNGPTIALSPLYIYRVRRPDVEPEFVAWWLNTPMIQSSIEASAVGSNIKTVPIAEFGKLTVPIVPLDLQRKVVQVDRLNREERKLEHELAEKRAIQIEQQLVDLVQGSGANQK